MSTEPIIKEYKDFTEEERNTSQSIYEMFLDKYCSSDEEGCHPCDYGCPCDKCNYDYDFMKDYVTYLVSHDVPITEDEARFLR